jgi:hypothetical protein
LNLCRMELYHKPRSKTNSRRGMARKMLVI